MGRASVLVGRRPRVAIVTTGDELVGVDQPLRPGAVRNSGAYVIPALVERAGGVDRVSGPRPDDPQAIREAIGAALEADVTVITGGMS